MRIPFISLAAIGALALGGCAYGDYGPGYGYGGYGYGNYGYGGGYYGGYAPYCGYGYGAFDPFGWYGDFITQERGSTSTTADGERMSGIPTSSIIGQDEEPNTRPDRDELEADPMKAARPPAGESAGQHPIRTIEVKLIT